MVRPRSRRVEIEDDGTVTARVGTSAHGQGHETAFSQIVADTLGVPFENVRVLHSDTDEVAARWGNGGSRSGQIGGSARSSPAKRCSPRPSASRAMLEANVDDIVLATTASRSRRAASKLAWADLAAAQDPAKRPEGVAERLQHELDFQSARIVVPRSARTSRSSRSTPRPVGRARPPRRGRRLRHDHQPDDRRRPAARRHRPGVAQVLWEEVQYDEDGNPITANLMDYAMRRRPSWPSYETYNTVTPTR